MRKLPPRYNPLALKFFVSVIMSGIVAAVAVFRISGLDGFPAVWLTSWGASWIIAFPAICVAMPLAQRIVFLFVERPPSA